MEIPGFLLRHTVSVRRQTGEGGLGDVYAAPISVRCFKDERRRLVRNAAGAEIVSEVTIYTRLKHKTLFSTDAEVTLPSGRVMHVQQAAERDDGNLGAWQHLEVVC